MSSTSSTQLLHEILGNFYSRKLLLHTTLYQQHETTASSPISTPPTTLTSHDAPEGSYPGSNSFDVNVVMVLSVLLCALICSLGLNTIIRCALRCSNLVSSTESGNPLTSAKRTNVGIKKKALNMFPIIQYSEGMKLDTECVICLAEFAIGERMRLLPKCSHGFHVNCIDRWLNSHSSCPTCRHCLIQTCEKITGGGGCNSASPPISQSSQPQQDHIILSIEPLQPEGLIRNYQT